MCAFYVRQTAKIVAGIYAMFTYINTSMFRIRNERKECLIKCRVHPNSQIKENIVRKQKSYQNGNRTGMTIGEQEKEHRRERENTEEKEKSHKIPWWKAFTSNSSSAL